MLARGRAAGARPRSRSPTSRARRSREVADFVLTTAARETTYRSGAMASRLAQLTVVDCLFVGVARQQTYARPKTALEATARGGARRDRVTRTAACGAAGERLALRARRSHRRSNATRSAIDIDHACRPCDVLQLINARTDRSAPAVAAVLRRGRRGGRPRGRPRCAPAAACTTSAPAPRAGSACSTRPSWRPTFGVAAGVVRARTSRAARTPCGGAVEDAEDDAEGGAAERGRVRRRRRRGGRHSRPAAAPRTSLGALRAARAAGRRAPCCSPPTRRRRRADDVDVLHRRGHRPGGRSPARPG